MNRKIDHFIDFGYQALENMDFKRLNFSILSLKKYIPHMSTWQRIYYLDLKISLKIRSVLQ